MNQQTCLQMENHLSVRAVLSFNIFSILIFLNYLRFLELLLWEIMGKTVSNASIECCICQEAFSPQPKKKGGEREKYVATSFLLAKVCFQKLPFVTKTIWQIHSQVNVPRIQTVQSLSSCLVSPVSFSSCFASGSLLFPFLPCTLECCSVPHCVAPVSGAEVKQSRRTVLPA